MKAIKNQKELKTIVKNLLTTNCAYKYIGRSGWICGFGNGRIAEIEDHRNELTIETSHYSSVYDLNKEAFINKLIDIKSASCNHIDDYIAVEDCDEDNKPEENLLKIAKRKLWFGFKITELEITEEDIDNSISKYYSQRETYWQDNFH